MTTISTTTFRTNSIIKEAIAAGAVGALAACVMTTINPIAGAIFGVTSTCGGELVCTLTDSVKCLNNSTAGKIANLVLTLLGAIGAGILATSLMGFPLTFTAGVTLTGAFILTGVAIEFIAEGLSLSSRRSH